ncbi:hypothetical protein CISG_02746 [Coccidioides immitis RMSCC 3703]|uniref:Uncharacterized protein n=1 Tax=Coccidioides immitis RMSCC 3703 TaxID=454286 RepID=A0A0J8RCV6_COCIT|nr:hypothetical protein CISG_02746 [Coccidioides immitis RMSCC 3703]
MADRKRFLSFMRTKGLQSLTGRRIRSDEYKPPDNEVYVAAGAIPKNKRDNEIKKTCEKKCREIHRERVSKCEGLKDGKDKCLKSAALLGSDKGQKQCVVPCVASIFGPHKGGLFADFYS